ncbi:Wzz/FepE/Etk N-terminal domain-containing protein [Psychrosphaera aquimarina]|uniref:Wzz/FepE/Etk N-terminal domain-containing protein n=1 Tax=Psychrosphaera aquimarina TaxID=2044854 RepID=A0ABU3R4D6_9GAMM|nr:Wzz/FepE/Etk N-terminal domain-containing protein [Psychrosphaera aquimarina]MDU0114557.1 Wzz/FepE/Etk N-terminal domain-containing protein [Psychrosphaera aquimarina]
MKNKENNELTELKAKLDIYEKWHNEESKFSNLNSSFSAGQSPDDEIDLKELWNVIWAGKLKIFVITAVFGIASVFYALSLPNIYKATTVLAPTNQESSGGLGGLASQYGGLAAMAGINLGGSGDNKIEHALELMKSWHYLDSFITKYNLKPTFMAVVGWNKTTNQLVYDDLLYNKTTKAWILGSDNITLEPSSLATYKTVSGSISVTQEKDTGLINLNVSHYSPNVAYDLTKLLTKELNDHFRNLDKQEAEASINFLTNKIDGTSNTEMRQVFYSMIEAHSKTLMMTEVNKQYLVKTLVPTMMPEQKDKPKRALIVVLGTMLGGILSVLFVLIRYFKNKN